MAVELEKQNLETHVELCALRYSNLENKLNNLEEKVEKLETVSAPLRTHQTKH